MKFNVLTICIAALVHQLVGQVAHAQTKPVLLATEKGMDDYTLSSSTLDFGTRDANNGPFTDSSIRITPSIPVTITNVQFSGINSQEFSLIAPQINDVVTSMEPLSFRWSPLSNDAQNRSVTATISTNASPSSFQIRLTANPTEPVNPDLGAIDLSGWKIKQFNQTAEYTFPEGIKLSPQQVLILARNHTIQNFEAQYGVTLSGVVYINSGNVLPRLIGGETFQLLDDQANQVDPPNSGFIPDGTFLPNRTFQRLLSNATVFTNSPNTSADPGEFNGVKNNFGNVIISEIVEPVGSSNGEYIELYYDATIVDPPGDNFWMLF